MFTYLQIVLIKIPFGKMILSLKNWCPLMLPNIQKTETQYPHT